MYMYIKLFYKMFFLGSDEELNVTHYTKQPNVYVTQNSKVGFFKWILLCK